MYNIYSLHVLQAEQDGDFPYLNADLWQLMLMQIYLEQIEVKFHTPLTQTASEALMYLFTDQRSPATQLRQVKGTDCDMACFKVTQVKKSPRNRNALHRNSTSTGYFLLYSLTTNGYMKAQLKLSFSGIELSFNRKTVCNT